ncbi:hypothetical protein PR048_027281 [Dryococelus australis]|uniref:Uncharacterized protein n=1 Tax=Dryococelus australis TaxID=614101 RepID=A0ABQ9GF06_9NEOP|nr:hypothetical protein PR048_027281 [Dryococelus australis]
MKGMIKREIPEKTLRPAASQRHRPERFPHAKIRETRPGIEPSSPWWEESRLTAQPPQPLFTSHRRVTGWNERAGKTGDTRENPPTSGIVRHGCHIRKAGEGDSDGSQTRFALDKIDFKRVYTDVTFAIGSEFIRRALDDSAPIADLQGNKKRIPQCQMWGNTGITANEQTSEGHSPLDQFISHHSLLHFKFLGLNPRPGREGNVRAGWFSNGDFIMVCTIHVYISRGARSVTEPGHSYSRPPYDRVTPRNCFAFFMFRTLCAPRSLRNDRRPTQWVAAGQSHVYDHVAVWRVVKGFLNIQISSPLPFRYAHWREGPRWVVVRLLASNLGEPGSIPGGVPPGFSHAGIVPDDVAGLRIVSGISRFPHPFILVMLHTPLNSPSSVLKTSMLRATQISSLTHSRLATPCCWSSRNKQVLRLCIHQYSDDLPLSKRTRYMPIKAKAHYHGFTPPMSDRVRSLERSRHLWLNLNPLRPNIHSCAHYARDSGALAMSGHFSPGMETIVRRWYGRWEGVPTSCLWLPPADTQGSTSDSSTVKLLISATSKGSHSRWKCARTPAPLVGGHHKPPHHLVWPPQTPAPPCQATTNCYELKMKH